jgi:predicted DNA-binding mobile mystery protein A
MPKITAKAAARRHLDRRLAALRPLVQQAAPPVKGWIRAIREALGMTAAQLASRIKVGRSAIAQLEASETRGTIQLDTLRKVAAAMDCALVYAFVPRESLEHIVMNRARQVAIRHFQPVEQTMALEDQSIDAEEREAQIETYIRERLDTRQLWDTPS